MTRALVMALGVVGLAIDGVRLARHLVLGTEPAWVARVRELVNPPHFEWYEP